VKQLYAANICDLSAKRIDIYATIIIAFALGLALLTPVEKPWRACDTSKGYLDAQNA
jgi:hypothetical protein|tara:strand:+ start:283 stop:453 length:171 start_codon:yes stop_codon:yes gene_type:complete